MGYYENCCQICAVSLNIARLRTKHEPASAGWGPSAGLVYLCDENTCLCTLKKEQSGCENIETEEQPRDVLHLPGPGCCFNGYSGHRIGAEEMQGMRYPRYIIKKPEDVENQYGEEPQEAYERDSEFFVTTQTVKPPYGGGGGEQHDLERVRFGIDTFLGVNGDFGVDDVPIGLPVHDACWKIFEKVCMKRLGKVDLQGFMGLWRRESCSNCGFQGLRQDQAIIECKGRWWSHHVGTEYLAANPFNIPGLSLVIQDHLGDSPEGQGVFRSRANTPREDNPTDLFLKLPTELRNKILVNLSSQDIASLRLVSRAFEQLPKWLFKQLIEDELPWFWELEEVHAQASESIRQQNIEAYGEKGEKFEEALPPYTCRDEQWKTDILDSIKRKRMSVNWMSVYRYLAVIRKSFLGLRNRTRIWKVTEEIVRRIGSLRERKGCPIGSGEMLDVTPGEDEIEAGLVTRAFYCAVCRV